MIESKKHLKQIFRTPITTDKREGYIRLNMNENISGLPKDFLKEALKEVTSRLLSTYPNYYELQHKIANHNEVEFENISLANGSDAAINYIFQTYISPKDNVLYVEPIFAMYPIYCNIYNANVIKLDYNNDFSFPFEKYVSAIKNNKIKIAIIVNPCNPLGSILEYSKLVELIEISKERDTILIVDEAYFYYYSDTIIKEVKKYSNLIVLRTFSKLCGIASERVGYLAACSDIINDIHKVKPTFDLCEIGVILATKILDTPYILNNLIEEFNKGKKYIIEELNKEGIEFYVGYANFILIKVNDRVDEIIQGLENEKILINGNYSHPLLEPYIRVSIADEIIMKKFWNKFKNLFIEN